MIKICPQNQICVDLCVKWVVRYIDIEVPLLPFLHGGHNVYRRVTRPLFLPVIDTARALGFTYNKGKGGMS